MNDPAAFWMVSAGKAGPSDHFPPILFDHANLLTTNALKWSYSSGEGWLEGTFFPQSCIIVELVMLIV
jgi:hypothetical protein